MDLRGEQHPIAGFTYPPSHHTPTLSPSVPLHYLPHDPLHQELPFGVVSPGLVEGWGDAVGGCRGAGLALSSPSLLAAIPPHDAPAAEHPAVPAAAGAAPPATPTAAPPVLPELPALFPVSTREIQWDIWGRGGTADGRHSIGTGSSAPWGCQGKGWGLQPHADCPILPPPRSMLPVSPTAVGPTISLDLDVDDVEMENYEVCWLCFPMG